MNQRQRWSVILALTLLIIPIYSFLFLTVRNEIRLNNFYITKNICNYRPQKTAIVLMDQRAAKTLKSLGVSFKDILDSANDQFKIHNLPIRYKLESEHSFYWYPKEKSCTFFDATFVDQKKCIINELSQRIKLMREKHDPDVIIFLTALREEVSAKSFVRKNYSHGNGTIVVNLGYHRIFKIKSKGVKKYFLRGYGQILAHEISHLYGLEEHVADLNSIMQETIEFGSPKVKFDNKSLKQLEGNLEKLKISQQKCAAR